MKDRQRSRRVRVVVGRELLASTAGGALLVETARATGLDRGVSGALEPWRKPLAVHDPGKVLTDLAMAIGLGVTAWPISGLFNFERATGVLGVVRVVTL